MDKSNRFIIYKREKYFDLEPIMIWRLKIVNYDVSLANILLDLTNRKFTLKDCITNVIKKIVDLVTVKDNCES